MIREYYCSTILVLSAIMKYPVPKKHSSGHHLSLKPNHAPTFLLTFAHDIFINNIHAFSVDIKEALTTPYPR